MKNIWVKFFFGNPQRVLMTLLGVVVFIGAFWPEEVNLLVRSALYAIWPLVQTVGILAIMFFAVRYMVFGPGGGGGGGGKKGKK